MQLKNILSNYFFKKFLLKLSRASELFLKATNDTSDIEVIFIIFLEKYVTIN